MLKATGREEEGRLDIKSIETFPCADLCTIDRLWVKYSDGHFGFSVQKRIWESVGCKPGNYDYEIYEKFSDLVGWRVKEEWLDYSNLTFSLNASEGHLPVARVMGNVEEIGDVLLGRGGVEGIWGFNSFFASRLEKFSI